MEERKKKTVIAKITLNENTNINYDKMKKLANYNNRNHAYNCTPKEIISNRKTCNNMKH